MQMTMRWFGPEEDKISLEHIRQVPGVEGVVGALYDVAVGEVWPVDKIERLVGQAHAAGLKMEVIESVNIHDDIKIGLPTRERYIANYQQTIRNLARFGVKVICYNFMPVFDWMKTDMNYVLPDGSLTMAFEKKDIDKRLEDVVKEVLENSNGFALPGWEPERLAEVQTLFAKYSAVDDQKLRENLVYFLQAVIPVCEEVGVKMAIHRTTRRTPFLACRGWSKTATIWTGSAGPSIHPPTALRSAPARLPKILIMTCTPSWPNLRGVSEFILPTSAI